MLLVTVLLVVALVFAVTNMGGDTLTDKEIQSLRTTYPVCGKEIPVGMYYVTDNEYAISLFDEISTTTKSISGVKVNPLLEKLKR